MNNLHGFLHDKSWITLHKLPWFTSGPPPCGKPNANPGRLCRWYRLWMRIEGPHNYKAATALSPCVKWALFTPHTARKPIHGCTIKCVWCGVVDH
jgi:hypothetical protein